MLLLGVAYTFLTHNKVPGEKCKEGNEAALDSLAEFI